MLNVALSNLTPLGVLTLLAVGCSDSGSGTATPPAQGNLALPIVQVDGGPDLWIATVYEGAAGETDLNGDGDTLDNVLHAFDIRTGEVSNLQLAASPVLEGSGAPSQRAQVDGDFAVFLVNERSQGETDLNADGDVLDTVAMVYDARTVSVRNLGLAVIGFGRGRLALSSGANRLFLGVSETMQGATDLNGDGLLGEVLHVHDLLDPATRNLGQSTEGGAMRVTPNSLGLFVKETGAADLNGDGDATDLVFHTFEWANGTFVNSGLACTGFTAHFADGVWVIGVREDSQGDGDLNGDDDVLDSILHTFDPDSGLVRNLVAPEFGVQTIEGDDFLVFQASERFGVVDLNNDGDLLDDVAVLHNVTTGTTTNLGLATERMIQLDDWIVLMVPEDEQGTDLSMDGDTEDRVVHILDPRTGVVRNLGTDSLFSIGRERYLVFLRHEQLVGQDLNSDGDMDDAILHTWDGETQALLNTRIQAVAIMDIRGDTLLIAQFESHVQRDNNGDGGMDDQFGAFYRFGDQGVQPLDVFVGSGQLIDQDTALLVVPEFQEGDLNGDGDNTDTVLQVARR